MTLNEADYAFGNFACPVPQHHELSFRLGRDVQILDFFDELTLAHGACFLSFGLLGASVTTVKWGGRK